MKVLDYIGLTYLIDKIKAYVDAKTSDTMFKLYRAQVNKKDIVTTANTPTDNPTISQSRFTYTLPEEVYTNWMLSGLLKYGAYDSNGNRVRISIEYATTMDGQKAIRSGYVVTRPIANPANIEKIELELLLTRRGFDPYWKEGD